MRRLLVFAVAVGCTHARVQPDGAVADPDGASATIDAARETPRPDTASDTASVAAGRRFPPDLTAWQDGWTGASGATFRALTPTQRRDLLTAAAPNRRVVDVTKKPYLALPNDDGDDTAILQLAISDNSGRLYVEILIYLPTGRYLVTDTLKGTDPFGRWTNAVHLTGQIRDGTVITLKDAAPGFGNASTPKAVIMTASINVNPTSPTFTAAWQQDGRGNGAFHNFVTDLTVELGSGNAGAIGIDYLVSNKGALENVRVTAGAGSGFAGVAFTRPNGSGPGMVAHVDVTGCDYGLYADEGIANYLMTIEDLTVRGQRKAGIFNGWQHLAIRGLTSANGLPALQTGVSLDGTRYTWGSVAIVDAVLAGGAATVGAIEFASTLFLRNVTTSGYRSALTKVALSGGQFVRTAIAGANIDEYTSAAPKRLFDNGPAVSLTLPVKALPVTDDTLADWTKPGARMAGEADDTRAIQRALDAGKAVVYFDRPRYVVSDTLVMRGDVRRLVGMNGCLDVSCAFEKPGCTAAVTPRKTALRIDDGSAPVVTIESLNSCGWTQGKNTLWVEHRSRRTLVLKDVMFGSGRIYRAYSGTGDLFIQNVDNQLWEDAPDAAYVFAAGQKVWARQLNPESHGFKIHNAGAVVWILGLKTESTGTVLKTSDGGSTEVIGAYLLPSGLFPNAMTIDKAAAVAQPAFINLESTMSLGPVDIVADDPTENYQTSMEETRGGEVRRTNWGGRIPLFVSHR